MDSYRKAAIIVGVLFIIGTVAGILNQAFLLPILDASDYLTKASANENQVIIGALFGFIMAVALAGVPIVIYPILKKRNEVLALGYVGARIVEGVFYIVDAISILLLLTLSQEFVKAGSPDASYFQTLGELLPAVVDWSGHGFGPIVWLLGAWMFYYLLYKSILVPRWLSGWGLIGVISALVAILSGMFGQIGTMSTTSIVLQLPIAVQEMVLAVWLIVKGFNPSAITSASAKTDAN